MKVEPFVPLTAMRHVSKAGVLLLLICSVVWVARDVTWEAAIAALSLLGTLLGIEFSETADDRAHRRAVRILRGHEETVKAIDEVISSAKKSVWLFRAHTGEGTKEKPFFQRLQQRLLDPAAPLEDVRRNSVIHASKALREDLLEFAEKFAPREGVQLALINDPYPRISIMLVDQRVAVLGFPTDGGGGISATLLTTDQDLVNAIATTYLEVWARSRVIFPAAPTRTDREVDEIKKTVKKILDANTVKPA